MVAERIEDKRVPHKELIFEFADDWLAGFCPATPMNVAQRISVAIIAQRDELIALTDIRGQGDSTRLIFHHAGRGSAMLSSKARPFCVFEEMFLSLTV